MRITNKALSQIFLDWWIAVNDLILYLEASMKLLKKYKKKLILSDILSVIKDVDKNLYSIVIILQYYEELDISSIKNIIKEIKQESKDYVPTFTINIIEQSQKYNIEDLLNKKFPKCSVKKNQNLDVWAFIHWEWWYYKRNIDQDLQKLLW